MTDKFAEARRLLAAGMVLCELHPNSKQPVGTAWNHRPVIEVREDAGGYGLPLFVNNMCSIDFDAVVRAEDGLRKAGFEPDWLRDMGVATSSTRPGSGGRVAFRVPLGARLTWIRFTSKREGTILELRATSPNLQDCLPGTTYFSKDGSGPWVQDYSGLYTFDCAPDLPAEFCAWWQRLSDDLEYRHEMQRLIAGSDATLDVSNGEKLAFPSTYRVEFNATHRVEDILEKHGYTPSRNGRWAPHTATGAPSVRRIPNKDDLWQSDHASDPLFGTFDAWTAYVTLEHGQNLELAEEAQRKVYEIAAVDGFDEVEAVTLLVDDDLFGDTSPVETEDTPLPSFERDKNGRAKATVNNVLLALRTPKLCGIRIGLDRFRDEIMLAQPGTNNWRPFGDADYTWLRAQLETGIAKFTPISKDMIRDVVLAVSTEHEFDSAITWLESLPDDGGNRCETFLIDYFGAEDTPYTRAVSLYLWTALAGRVLQPGCKADMVPILVGDQGLGKSTAISALVPSPDFFVEVSFAEKDDDLARKMRGKLVAEIGELRGLHTKELEAIKAFITRTHEQWIPKYREFTTTFPRRLVFIGSTNKDQFLADETGNRRWLPVRVSQVAVDRVRAVAPLCWAEARRRFKAGGVQWSEAEKLGRQVHEEFTFRDSWEESVRRWLSEPLFAEEGELPTSGRPIRVSEVLVGALGYDPKNITRREEMRMGALLRQIGYSRKRMQISGVQDYFYLPTLPTLK
jgi:hypothetical protein